MSTANHFEPSLRGPRKAQIYEFHPFLLDTIQHVLLKEDRPVTLTPKTYDTLLLLVQNSGRMLSKEELMKSLWPDSFVEESNLTQQVSMIRRALGDSPGDPHFIVTVPGRGYRFSAEVRSWEDEKEQFGLTVSAPQLVGEAASRNAQKVAQTAGADFAATENAEPVAVPFGWRDRKTIRWTVLSIAALALLGVAILAITKLFAPDETGDWPGLGRTPESGDSSAAEPPARSRQRFPGLLAGRRRHYQARLREFIDCQAFHRHREISKPGN